MPAHARSEHSSRFLSPYRHLPEGAKRRLWWGIPNPVWRALERVVGHVHAPLDAAPLARIATVPLARLSDPDFLAQDLLPAMGLTTHGADEPFFPSHLTRYVGRGVRSLQFPNQFGPFLATMTQAGVRSYLELGVHVGGTFAITVEVLRRFGLQRAIAVDLDRPPLLDQWSRPEVEFYTMDSHSSAFADLVRARDPIDLAFIDGDHSEEGVRKDFEVLRPHVRMLAFHDIVQPGYPGIEALWTSIKEQHRDEYECQEFVAQYPVPYARLGIGVAIRRHQRARDLPS